MGPCFVSGLWWCYDEFVRIPEGTIGSTSDPEVEGNGVCEARGRDHKVIWGLPGWSRSSAGMELSWGISGPTLTGVRGLWGHCFWD